MHLLLEQFMDLGRCHAIFCGCSLQAHQYISIVGIDLLGQLKKDNISIINPMNLIYQIYLICLMYMYILENNNSPNHAPKRPTDTLQLTYIPTFWQYKSNSKVLIELICIPKLLVLYI